MPKLPTQKRTHNDVSRDTQKQILKEIKKAWASDNCTEKGK